MLFYDFKSFVALFSAKLGLCTYLAQKTDQDTLKIAILL